MDKHTDHTAADSTRPGRQADQPHDPGPNLITNPLDKPGAKDNLIQNPLDKPGAADNLIDNPLDKR